MEDIIRELSLEHQNSEEHIEHVKHKYCHHIEENSYLKDMFKDAQ